MSRLTSQPSAPASTDDVRTVNGAVANLHLKGKQGELTSMLLAVADKNPRTMLETDVLKGLYRGSGVENSHKNSLRNLALQINKRLKQLPVDGLTVSGETSGNGAKKLWGLRIEKRTGKPFVGVGFAVQGNGAKRIAKPQFKWSGLGASH